MKLGDYAMEDSGDCFGTKTLVKIVKVFKDGSCHVEDDETKARRTIKWRASHMKKLTEVAK